jgi:hypothetical protein
MPQRFAVHGAEEICSSDLGLAKIIADELAYQCRGLAMVAHASMADASVLAASRALLLMAPTPTRTCHPPTG